MTKILLVEDNEMNRDMLVRRLVRLGYEVQIAGNGLEAMAKVDAGAPDVILMDMSLPVQDGWTTTAALKQKDETRHIPILGLSAHAMSHDRQRAMEAGCDEYETKPVVLQRLIAKIDALVGKGNAE